MRAAETLSVTFAAVLDAWLDQATRRARRAEAAALRSVCKRLRAGLGHLDAVADQDIARYLAGLDAEGLSARTQANHLGVLRRVLGSAAPKASRLKRPAVVAGRTRGRPKGKLSNFERLTAVALDPPQVVAEGQAANQPKPIEPPRLVTRTGWMYYRLGSGRWAPMLVLLFALAAV